MPLLTCPHCGSAVSALSTETAPLRCPVCGATLHPTPDPAPVDAGLTNVTPLPIREAVFRDTSSHSGGWEEDDSATHAVADDRMEPILAEARSDHQLHQEERSAEALRSADEATHALPYTPPATPGAAPTAGAAASLDEATHELPFSATPQAAEQRRTSSLRALSLALVALALVAIIIVAALVGNGLLGGGVKAPSAATATTAPAPTAAPAGVSFQEPGLYQLTYPHDWFRQARNDPPKTYYTLFTAPTGGVSVNVEAQQLPKAPDPVALDQQFIATVAQPGSTPSNVSAPSDVTVGGQTWRQVTADVTLAAASGQPTNYAHVLALSTQRGAYTYTIVCIASSPSAAAAGPAFTTANQTFFQPVLASFSFLS